MDAGTVVEIVGEEVGVKCGAHQNDPQVAPLHNQVFQHQQQKVAGRGKRCATVTKTLSAKDRELCVWVITSPPFAHALRPQ